MSIVGSTEISLELQQKSMPHNHAIDEYQAEKFFRSWLNLHKQAQYLFSIVQDRNNIELKCIKANHFLGIIHLFNGKFSLEIYKKNGRWVTDQRTLIPFAEIQ